MPQSLARLPIHLVFSTKKRERFLRDEVRAGLHAYMVGVLQHHGCPVLLMNSVADHGHILFELGRTIAVSKAVEEVKKASSKWIKSQGPEYSGFAWQGGYGAFAVSDSDVPLVLDYIRGQQEHHRVKSFQEEYVVFLEQHRIAFDERYVWD